RSSCWNDGSARRPAGGSGPEAALNPRPMLTTPPAGYLRLGRLGRSFKLDGGVRLHVEAELADDELEALLTSGARLFVAGLGETRLRGLDDRTGSNVLLLEGVRDRTAARALVNAAVYVHAQDLPAGVAEALSAPSSEEVLTGMPVVVDGHRWGEVSAAHLNAVNPYVEVRSDTGSVSLVALAAPYVEVTEEAVVLTSPPDGLLD